MKIQEDLVWDRDTGDLIGCVNLGNAELNAATLKKTSEFTSRLLVFLVRTIFLFFALGGCWYFL